MPDCFCHKYSFLFSDFLLIALFQGSESLKLVKFQCYVGGLFANYFIFSHYFVVRNMYLSEQEMNYEKENLRLSSCFEYEKSIHI